MRSLVPRVVVTVMALLGAGAGLLGWQMSPTAAVPPTGWKVVSALGVRLDVPDSWPVRYGRWTPCGVDSPLVDLNAPLSGPVPSCIGEGPAAEVIVRAARSPRTRPAAHSTLRTLNGLSAWVRVSTYRALDRTSQTTKLPIVDLVDVWIRSPMVTITIRVGVSVRLPGGHAGRADQILRSIGPAFG